MATSTDWLPGVDLTGKSWWDIVQLVNAQHGPNAVAEMANSGFFDSMPSFSSGDRESLGRYIAARQAEQDNDIFDNPTDALMGTLGLSGGLTGASLATGNVNSSNVLEPLALDAAGLAAGSGLAGLMGGAAPAAVAPSAASGGTTLGTGLTAGAAGASGLSTAAAGAGGLTAPATGLGALSSGFFGAESLYPVVGGVTAGTVAGNVAGNAAGGAASGIGMNQILAGAIPAAFGAYGANQQANAYEGLARDYMNMGAPYRSKLSDLYANPSAFLNSPEVQVPVQQGTDALARALSVQGNPIGSGSALQELQNYSSNQLFSRLGQEKDRLAGFGGLSAYNQAAPAAAGNAINANKGIYDAIGAGAADVFYPPRRYSLSGLAGLV